MKVTLLAATLGLGFLAASPAHAQVSADIQIGNGPVAGRIIVGDHYPVHRDVYVRRYPVRRVVVDRYQPRVIAVERFHRGHGWSKHHQRDYRPVHVYYDGRSRYYDRYQRGLREVTVYQFDGRYYRDDDRDFDDRYDRDRNQDDNHQRVSYDDE
ncbi:MAG: hypothetical protein ABI679_15095 [Gemmatimonadota bacterium]